MRLGSRHMTITVPLKSFFQIMRAPDISLAITATQNINILHFSIKVEERGSEKSGTNTEV